MPSLRNNRGQFIRDDGQLVETQNPYWATPIRSPLITTAEDFFFTAESTTNTDMNNVPEWSTHRIPVREPPTDYCYTCQRDLALSMFTPFNQWGRRVCLRCVEKERVWQCNSCGHWLATDEYRECHSCIRRQIPGHEYLPTLTHFHGDRERPNKRTLFFGFELEVEFGNQRQNVLNLCRRYPWLFFKHDGSLADGLEIVSHPVTLGWLDEHREELHLLLEGLNALGCRTPRSCGLHVHLNKASFYSNTLYKFQKLIYENTDEMLRLANRDQSRAERFASLWNEPRQELMRKAIFRSNAHDNRYVAVNLCNIPTVEVRLFSASLESEMFFRHLEFCFAAHAYTAQESTRHVTWRRFKTSVNRKTYPHLYTYLYQ